MFHTWDIEARNWNEITGIGAFDGSSYHFFSEINQFIEYALSKKGLFYAHYGGKYDNLFLVSPLMDRARKVSMQNINGKIIIRADKTKFLDSALLLPPSLKQLTSGFNVQHKKLDYTDFEHKDIGLMKKYLRHDCIGLHEVLSAFFNEMWQFTNRIGLTLGSYAINIFRQLSGYRFISLKEQPEIYARLAYKGGRTEVFRRRASCPLWYYDVNSLYPFVMLNNSYPVGALLGHLSGEQAEAAEQRGLLGVCRCRINAPYSHIPFNCVRSGGKLLFVYGSFEEYLTSADIQYNRQIGNTVQIIDGYYWQDSDFIFKNYVEYFYKIKRESKDGKREVAKLLLNSCYGKFGQHREHGIIKTEAQIKPEEQYSANWRGYKVGQHYFFLGKKEDGYRNPNIQPQIAAFVCSYARIHLHRLIHKIGAESVYYCDTDSILTDKKHSELLGEEIGQLKEVGKYRKGIFLTNKTYALIGKTGAKLTAKGLTKEHTEKLKFKDYEALLDGDTFSFFGRRKGGFLETLIRGGGFEAVYGSKRARKVRNYKKHGHGEYPLKTLKDTYDKRHILEGGITSPFSFEELQAQEEEQNNKKAGRAHAVFSRKNLAKTKEFLKSDLWDGEHAGENEYKNLRWAAQREK